MTTAIKTLTRQYCSIADAQRATGLSRGTLTTAIRRGILKGYKPTPRRVLIAVEDLEAFVKGCPVGSEDTPSGAA